MRRNLVYLTYMAVLITFAVVIHTVEAALPLPMPVPGVRLGLANIITLLTIALYGVRSGLLVACCARSWEAFHRHFSRFWLLAQSLRGVLSCLVMAMGILLVKRGVISLLSVSVLGAAHNLGQVAVASLIVASFTLLRGYFPLLLLLAVPTGIFTGLAAHYLEGITRRVLYQAGGAGVPR